ncbi:MAG: hypothetical protein AB7R55_20275 [Gemmatimonadales bacterium]
MERLRRLGWLASLSFSIALGSCSDSTDPGGDGDDVKDPDELAFLQLPANHPPFFNTSTSFYAKIDRSSEAKLYFQEPGGGRGEEFAVLKIDSGTLLARPDGTPYGPGDSVLITMRIVDQSLVQVELLPSGIRFSSSKPAELKLDYEETEGDLDGDGDHDDEDDTIETRLSIWRQENPGDPFVKIGTVKTEGARELKAFLTSFSRYAISY